MIPGGRSSFQVLIRSGSLRTYIGFDLPIWSNSRVLLFVLIAICYVASWHGIELGYH